MGRRFWYMDDEPANPAWPQPLFEQESLRDSGDAIALAVALTHDVATDVRAFVKATLHDVRMILHCRLHGGPSQQSFNVAVKAGC